MEKVRKHFELRIRELVGEGPVTASLIEEATLRVLEEMDPRIDAIEHPDAPGALLLIQHSPALPDDRN